MMKRWSIKLKLTCLYGGFMLLLIVAALAILFSLSTQEVLSSVQSDLKEQVQGSVEELEAGDVMTLRLWREGSWLERQVPLVEQYTLE